MPDVHRLPLQWSIFADRMLRQCARTMDACAIAVRFGRTPMEVRARALAIGVELTGEADVMDRAWGSGELSFLRQQYRRRTPAEIGRQLGRSAGAVRRKLESLGLRKRPAEPRPAFLAPAAGPEPDPAFSVNALDSVAVAGIEAVERRMEQEAEPESAPWKEPETEVAQIGEDKNESEIKEIIPASQTTVKQPAQPFRWWTSDEDERLRQLVKAKTPLPELAGALGRSEEEVARRIARVCAEPDPAVQASNQAWGYGRTKKPRPKAKPAGPIPEDRLASMSNLDVLRALAGLA